MWMLNFNNQIVSGQFCFTWIALRLSTYISLEFSNKEANKCVVEIFSSQESVTIGRFYLKHSFLDFQDGHIKGSTSQVINSNTEKS